MKPMRHRSSWPGQLHHPQRFAMAARSSSSAIVGSGRSLPGPARTSAPAGDGPPPPTSQLQPPMIVPPGSATAAAGHAFPCTPPAAGSGRPGVPGRSAAPVVPGARSGRPAPRRSCRPRRSFRRAPARRRAAGRAGRAVVPAAVHRPRPSCRRARRAASSRRGRPRPHRPTPVVPPRPPAAPPHAGRAGRPATSTRAAARPPVPAVPVVPPRRPHRRAARGAPQSLGPGPYERGAVETGRRAAAVRVRRPRSSPARRSSPGS